MSRLAKYVGCTAIVLLNACSRSGVEESQHFIVEYTRPYTADDAREVLGILEEAAGEMKNELGYGPPSRVKVILYSSSPEFSSATGKPWWFGAVYDGRIHLQPLATLKRRGILRSSLRHEYVHLIFHTSVRAPTPLWFEEGFAEFFAETGGLPGPDGPVEGQGRLAAEGPPQAGEGGATRKSNATSGEWLEKASQLDQSREETEKFYHAARERVRGIVAARGLAGLREILSALAAGIPFERTLREKTN